MREKDSRREQKRAILRGVLLSAVGSCETQIEGTDSTEKQDGVFTLDCISAQITMWAALRKV
jgi:hypothetical protein